MWIGRWRGERERDEIWESEDGSGKTQRRLLREGRVFKINKLLIAIVSSVKREKERKREDKESKTKYTMKQMVGSRERDIQSIEN